MTYYVLTLCIYALAALLSCWGLDLQFGETGVLNFAYIIFFAAGGYTASILTLGHPGSGGSQSYFWGARLPWPVPWIVAAAVGGILGLAVGALILRRLRGDYQAMVLLVVSLMATYIVTAAPGFLNGGIGLSGVPAPFKKQLHAGPVGYEVFYVFLSLAVAALIFELVRRLKSSPLGRVLRAVRENEEAAEAVGHNVAAIKLVVMVIGGSIAAVGGAMEVQFIGAWAPAGWTYMETFGLFAAIIVGGTGNLLGVTLGAVLVQGIFLEGTVLLPNLGNPAMVGATQQILLAVLILAFLWFRPQGIIPARRRRFAPTSASHVAARLQTLTNLTRRTSA